jgi:hypothetical protein
VSSCCALGAAVVAGQSAPTPVFTDVTAQSGIRFVHNNGAFGKKYLPETLGAGVVVFDADGDGWQDLLFVNSMNWPGHPGAKSYPALYRNRHDGTFADVTRGSGLDVEMYGIGGAAADFDNDGKVDVYLTALGSSHLPQCRRRQVRRCHRQCRRCQPGVRDQRALVRLRQRRQARFVRRPLCRLVDREGSVLHA